MSIRVREFEWDEGNRNKNLIKHNVTDEEAEEVFFNRAKYTKTYGDRYKLLGVTNSGRYLTVIFALKKHGVVRIISARDMTDKERRNYKKK